MPQQLPNLRGQTLQSWIALIVAITLALFLMATNQQIGNDIIRSRTIGMLSFLARPFSIFPAVFNLAGENVRLRSENTRLKLREFETAEATRENKRLRKLLKFKEFSPFNLSAAKVIANNPMSDVYSLLINIGKAHGAKKNQAVINDQGLVGKLAVVSENNSIVQLLLDRNLGVAVRFTDSRVNGITTWVGGSNLLIESIPSSATIHLDEQIVTSGLDALFPAGIPVGRVTQTQKVKESLFLNIEVEPYVDFSVLEEVFIVFSGSTVPSTP